MEVEPHGFYNGWRIYLLKVSTPLSAKRNEKRYLKKLSVTHSKGYLTCINGSQWASPKDLNEDIRFRQKNYH